MLRELNEELKAEVASKVFLIDKMANEPLNHDNHPTLGLHLPGEQLEGEDIAEIKALHEAQLGEMAIQMDMELAKMKADCDRKIEEVRQQARGEYTDINTEEDEEKIGLILKVFTLN